MNDICLIDSGNTHTILKDTNFFKIVTLVRANISIIYGLIELIDVSDNATLTMPNGITLNIENAILSSKSNKNLLSFKDIRLNGFHIETQYEDVDDYLCLT